VALASASRHLAVGDARSHSFGILTPVFVRENLDQHWLTASEN
jgi:hypothetical protein